MPLDGLLLSMFELFTSNATNEASNKLKNGDVANEAFSEIIKRDLHYIKTKLHNLSKIDLCSSFDNMEEGFLQLFECFYEVQRNEECKEASNNDDSQSTCIATRYELSSEIQRSKVFELARDRFKESNKKVTEAFNIKKSTLEDRIFAIIVKIVAQIFECPEHPTNIINLCLTYIERLHQLDGVREMFSVFIGGGFKSRLKKSQRKENMKSVILLNHHLYQFIARINNNHDHLSTWPIIELRDGKVFNSMCDWGKIFTLEDWGKELIESSREMGKMKAIMFQIMKKMIENLHVQVLTSPNEGMLNPVRGDILIADGLKGESSKSFEIFSWKEEKWFDIASMKNKHNNASSFIYNDNLFVVGGFLCKSIETLNLNQLPLTWKTFPQELPCEYFSHQTVVYKQQILHIGGYGADKGASALISEIQITDSTSDVLKQLCQMPEPRKDHGAEIVDDKVLIFGGRRKFAEDAVSSVLEFDPRTLTFKEMPPLPHPLYGMATVRWRDQVVLLGGRNDGREILSSVIMYDSKTGKITVLPSMLERRLRCCAVITGDTIAVMGGMIEKIERLKSVECFEMGSSSSWTYLPSMNEPRAEAIAEFLPSGQKYV
ncbi:uncharacterized protein LOC124436423 [Xenia sp. Carnegie-2017]|uniref:uncharacterized protein LOC124436423 n=1 Tax=Xenia sp. Carnegie-2017 TaxID=2897299 RepID=UPI001F03E89C|nr:uncharacterized protein LOC124436423 [Xenia sp. Carnegie-2017]